MLDLRQKWVFEGGNNRKIDFEPASAPSQRLALLQIEYLLPKEYTDCQSKITGPPFTHFVIHFVMLDLRQKWVFEGGNNRKIDFEPASAPSQRLALL